MTANDLTDEEVSELETRFQDMISGKVSFVGEKESIRMIIEAAENFTPEEIAELERRRARHLRGEGTSYTLEESIQSCATPGNEALRPDGPPAPASLPSRTVK